MRELLSDVGPTPHRGASGSGLAKVQVAQLRKGDLAPLLVESLVANQMFSTGGR
jgi:hypothetical protein